MLIKKPQYQKNDIISLKLTNGDEIIAKFVDETDLQYVLNHPLSILPSHNGLLMIGSLFTGELKRDVIIEKSHVMFSSPTVDGVADQYREKTTGIQTVTRGGLIT